MHQISVYGDSIHPPGYLARECAGVLGLEYKPLESSRDPAPGRYTVFDIDLRDSAKLLTLKDWLSRKPKDAKVIFVTDRTSRLQETRAYAIGATDIVHRPVSGRALLTKLWGDIAGLGSDPATPADQQSAGVAVAAQMLENIFSAASLGAPPWFTGHPIGRRRDRRSY